MPTTTTQYVDFSAGTTTFLHDPQQFIPTISIFFVIILALFTFFCALVSLWLLFIFCRATVLGLARNIYKALDPSDLPKL